MKKVLIIAGVAVALLALVGFSVQQSKKNVTTVQTGKVVREDLATVVSTKSVSRVVIISGWPLFWLADAMATSR